MRRRSLLLAVALGAAACGGASDDAMSAKVVAGVSSAAVPAVISIAPPTTVAPPATVPAAPAAPRAPRPSRQLQVMGRLIIPRLGLDTTVYEGEELSIIDHGPGHFPGSAQPGRIGNVVIAGHRVTHSKPFRNLDQLQPGDTATFEVPHGTYTYTFTGHDIVTPERTDITAQGAEYKATLFACHPPGSAKFRIVSYWKLTSAPEPGQPVVAT
jgi:sortase A